MDWITLVALGIAFVGVGVFAWLRGVEVGYRDADEFNETLRRCFTPTPGPAEMHASHVLVAQWAGDEESMARRLADFELVWPKEAAAFRAALEQAASLAQWEADFEDGAA